MNALLSHLGGTLNGAFFRITPDYVDLKKQPGASAMPVATLEGWLRHAPLVLVDTPNLVWALIALAVYFAFPYDLSPTGAAARGPLSWTFIAERAPLWVALTTGYVAFWHITLYWLHWADRPFIAARPYSWEKVAHNVFWSTMGICIWLGFENVFAFLWATGRLPYESDTAAFSSTAGMLRFAAALAGIPLWRSFHFYFAHRLLHFKALYQQVSACAAAGVHVLHVAVPWLLRRPSLRLLFCLILPCDAGAQPAPPQHGH